MSVYNHAKKEEDQDKGNIFPSSSGRYWTWVLCWNQVELFFSNSRKDFCVFLLKVKQLNLKEPAPHNIMQVWSLLEVDYCKQGKSKSSSLKRGG